MPRPQCRHAFIVCAPSKAAGGSHFREADGGEQDAKFAFRKLKTEFVFFSECGTARSIKIATKWSELSFLGLNKTLPSAFTSFCLKKEENYLILRIF